MLWKESQMEIVNLRGQEVASNPALLERVVDLIHQVFMEPPWSFDWQRGSMNDRAGSISCSAFGFVNMLLNPSSDFVLLGETEFGMIKQPAVSLYGVAVGSVLSDEKINEASLAEVGAQVGDYYLTTVAITPEYRCKRYQDHSVYREMILRRVSAAQDRRCSRIFARTIVGAGKVQGLLPAMGFKSLGTFTVMQAGMSSCREYFMFDMGK
jgi:hypothetical protein